MTVCFSRPKVPMQPCQGNNRPGGMHSSLRTALSLLVVCAGATAASFPAHAAVPKRGDGAALLAETATSRTPPTRSGTLANRAVCEAFAEELEATIRLVAEARRRAAAEGKELSSLLGEEDRSIDAASRDESLSAWALRLLRRYVLFWHSHFFLRDIVLRFYFSLFVYDGNASANQIAMGAYEFLDAERNTNGKKSLEAAKAKLQVMFSGGNEGDDDDDHSSVPQLPSSSRLGQKRRTRKDDVKDDDTDANAIASRKHLLKSADQEVQYQRWLHGMPNVVEEINAYNARGETEGWFSGSDDTNKQVIPLSEAAEVALVENKKRATSTDSASRHYTFVEVQPELCIAYSNVEASYALRKESSLPSAAAFARSWNGKQAPSPIVAKALTELFPLGFLWTGHNDRHSAPPGDTNLFEWGVAMGKCYVPIPTKEGLRAATEKRSAAASAPVPEQGPRPSRLISSRPQLLLALEQISKVDALVATSKAMVVVVPALIPLLKPGNSKTSSSSRKVAPAKSKGWLSLIPFVGSGALERVMDAPLPTLPKTVFMRAMCPSGITAVSVSTRQIRSGDDDSSLDPLTDVDAILLAISSARRSGVMAVPHIVKPSDVAFTACLAESNLIHQNAKEEGMQKRNKGSSSGLTIYEVAVNGRKGVVVDDDEVIVVEDVPSADDSAATNDEDSHDEGENDTVFGEFRVWFSKKPHPVAIVMDSTSDASSTALKETAGNKRNENVPLLVDANHKHLLRQLEAYYEVYFARSLHLFSEFAGSRNQNKKVQLSVNREEL